MHCSGTHVCTLIELQYRNILNKQNKYIPQTIVTEVKHRSLWLVLGWRTKVVAQFQVELD